MTQLETRTEPMVVNFGPHHPSMHGVLRLVVTLDGEDVVDCEPVIGYLHRGMEKIAENRTNVMFVPYVSRMDYAAGMFYEAVVVNAPEKLADIPVPRRASYIRVLMLELNRIANHLLWLGPDRVWATSLKRPQFSVDFPSKSTFWPLSKPEMT